MSVFLVTGGAVLHFSSSCTVSVCASVALALVLDGEPRFTVHAHQVVTGTAATRSLIPLLWAAALAAMPLLLEQNLLNHGWLCSLAPAVSICTVVMLSHSAKLRQTDRWTDNLASSTTWFVLVSGWVVAFNAVLDLCAGTHARTQITFFRWDHYYTTSNLSFKIHVASGAIVFAVAPALLLAHKSRSNTKPTNLWIRCQQAVSIGADKHCMLGMLCVVAQVTCATSSIWLVHNTTLGWHVKTSSNLFAFLAILCSLAGLRCIWQGKRRNHAALMCMSIASSYGIVFVRLAAAVMHSFGWMDLNDFSIDVVQAHYGCSFWAGFALAPAFAMLLICNMES